MILTIQRLQFRFSPSLLPTLAALATVALTVYLGQWQQGRAAEKRGLQAQYEARAHEPAVVLDATSRDPALQYRQAVGEGEWQGTNQVYVDNKVKHERAGYYVITPLKLAGSTTYVLVNRGWIARTASYPLPPKAETPTGQVKVAGLLSVPTQKFLELSPQSVQGEVWQNLTVERFREATKLDVLPYVLLTQDTAAPLAAVSEKPDARVEKHIEYMLTWYSLAATAIVLWLVLNTKISRADLTSFSNEPAPTKEKA